MKVEKRRRREIAPFFLDIYIDQPSIETRINT